MTTSPGVRRDRPARIAWSGLIVLILTALSLWTAAGKTGVPAAEAAVLDAVYEWPQWLIAPMIAVTMLGSWQFAVLAVVGCVVFGKKMLALRLGLAAWLAGLLTAGLKIAVSRPRPAGLHADIIVRWPGYLQDYGFPSGHSAVAAAMAATIWLGLPKKARRTSWLILLVALPALVGLSRVYLGAHWPLDVLGGWLAGLLAAQSALWLGCQLKRFWL